MRNLGDKERQVSSESWQAIIDGRLKCLTGSELRKIAEELGSDQTTDKSKFEKLRRRYEAHLAQDRCEVCKLRFEAFLIGGEAVV